MFEGLEFLDLSFISIVLSILSIIAAIVSLRISAHKDVNVKRVEELKSDLNKLIMTARSLMNSPFAKQVSTEVKNPNKVYCKSHGWVYPIILPDGSLLCPHLHRLYPYEQPFENSDSIKVDIKDDEISTSKKMTLKEQIEDIKKRLSKLEETAKADTQVIVIKPKKETKSEEEDLF